jgi:Ca-activated chloride channel family protein
MNINPDDPKWTAYVLGELNDAERAQVENELESSAAAREVVEEIRLATSLLKEELAKDTVVGLSTKQRRAVAAAASAQPQVRPLFRWLRVAASAAAIALIVATLSIPSLLRSRQAATPASTIALMKEQSTTVPQTTSAPSLGDKGAAPLSPSSQAAGARREKLEAETRQFAQLQQQGQQGQLPQQEYFPREYRLGSNSFIPETKAFIAEPTVGPGSGGGVGVAPAALPDRADRPKFNTETYDLISDNPFILVAQDPLATFSVDVDTASYSNIRRFLTMNQLPPKDSVRIEEMINYFTYDYPSPTGRHPVGAYTEVAAAPWAPDHRLVRIGIKAKDVDVSKRPPSNLVFLIDVSGSMATPEKLPMLKSAMKLMVEKLGEGDHVAIVTYAAGSGVRLPSTSGDKKEVINAAIDNLNAGGGTNGGAGILLAYETAISNFIRSGINRVVLATDGDFNLGVTNQGDLIRIIEGKAKSGVFLSVLGFGMGNYKDSTLEKLADKGNGNYAYIDTLNEARKVLVEEMSGTLLTVAKDVKIQVEFNPAEVNAYRLIGYENRALRHQDFNDDKKDAGDMGAGQSVTALFEVVPSGRDMQIAEVDTLKYQQRGQLTARARNNREILNLRIRYKEPEGTTSQLIEAAVLDRSSSLNNASTDFRFAAAVASFGMILRDSPYKGQSTIDAVIDMAEKSRGNDKNGYREEFVQLVRKARALKPIQ